jgi:hypothetical protein
MSCFDLRLLGPDKKSVILENIKQIDILEIAIQNVIQRNYKEI